MPANLIQVPMNPSMDVIHEPFNLIQLPESHAGEVDVKLSKSLPTYASLCGAHNILRHFQMTCVEKCIWGVRRHVIAMIDMNVPT